MARESCLRCRRPSGHCFCALIPRLETRTRVLFLQHPRESRVAIGTARMTHLALPNSELREGVTFAEEALAADPETAVLFPDPEAAPAFVPAPRTLIVVDGTWSQARQLIRMNPILSRMRRIGLVPARPGAYRIRREPAPECLATVEAVAQVLGVLEDDPERFATLLAAFTFMVERQLAWARTSPTPRRRDRPRGPRWPELATLAAAPETALLVHCEANAHGPGERSNEPPELLHLVAGRPARGERFEALLVPRRPLGSRTAFHLDIDAARLSDGEPVAAALARFAAFLRPHDQLCGWGSFAGDVLEREGLPPRPRVDLRAVVARRLPDQPGGLPRVAAAMAAGPATSPWAAGRAGRMMASLECVLGALLGAYGSSDGQ